MAEEEKSLAEMRDAWMRRAVILIDQGGSELTIINFVSGQGVSSDTAIELGKELYREARAVVVRKRLPITIAGWLFILAGFVVFTVLVILAERVVIVVLMVPFLVGLAFLNRARVRR